MGSSWQTWHIFIAGRRPQLGILLIRHDGCAALFYLYARTYTHTHTDSKLWLRLESQDLTARQSKCLPELSLGMHSHTRPFTSYSSASCLAFLLARQQQLALQLLQLVNWIKVQMLAINITKKLMPHVCACACLCVCMLAAGVGLNWFSKQLQPTVAA